MCVRLLCLVCVDVAVWCMGVRVDCVFVVCVEMLCFVCGCGFCVLCVGVGF